MREMIDLVAAWQALPCDAEAVLATVVATSGSTYRRPGARMLMTRDGRVAGSISGGCLEADLLLTAFDRTADGPVLATYDASADEDIVWGYGMGCNGTIQVLIQRLPADGGPIAVLAEVLRTRQSIILSTCVAPGPDLGATRAYPATNPPSAQGQRGWGEGAGERPETLFTELLLPPTPLIVLGAGQDAGPVVDAAKALGWHVTVADAKPGFATPARFPNADAHATLDPEQAADALAVDDRTAVVVMTHTYLTDRALLRSLLPSRACYVGLLGPKRRAERLIAELRDDGFAPTEAQMSRFHAPIGLDLGAEGADEIALAIVAEIQAVTHRRTPKLLREHDGPLHDQLSATTHSG